MWLVLDGACRRPGRDECNRLPWIEFIEPIGAADAKENGSTWVTDTAGAIGKGSGQGQLVEFRDGQQEYLKGRNKEGLDGDPSE